MRNDLYQTSPYIVFDKPRSDYFLSVLTDKRYPVNENIASLLKYCKYPRTLHELSCAFSDEIIMYGRSEGLIVPIQTVWRKTNITYVAVEVTTHCNYRCQYCPVRIWPKPAQVMAMSLYENIIRKIVEHKSIKYISLSLYNEPTLDPFFYERLKFLADAPLKLMLITNGSNLNKNMLEALKAYGKVERINFNLPTLSPQKFQQMTGSKLYLQSVNNIKRAIQMGFNCYIIVNGTKQEICENLSAMQNFFGADMKDRIISFGTVDRAGNLKNKYFLNLHYTKQLRGCTHGIRWLSIDIDGDCITCCMDFKKENTFGNIRNQSIQEMLQDTKAVTLRKKIFGAQYSEADFICRRCLDCKQAVRFWNYSKDFAPVYNFSQSFGRKVLK